MKLEDMVKELMCAAVEEEWFEFKENWYEPTGIGEYISSLSNAAAMVGKESGYLVWGVNNETHELTDTSFDYRVDVKNEPLEHFLARQVTPDINFSFHELRISGRRVVVLVVPAANRTPTAFNGIRYIRIGSSKVNLSRFPERETQLFSILNYGVPTLENTPAFVQELTFNTLFDSYRDAGIPLKKETFETNLELKTSKGKYNLLAQLLSDNSHMSVRVIQYVGKDKSSPLYAVRNMGDDCILSSFRKLMTYGDVLNVMQSDERDRFAERKEVALFDSASYREAVINALVHNDWTDGNGPSVLVFCNRIEIVSNGPLVGKQTINGFFNGVSVPRNRKLAEIFLQLHISERSGRGVPVITKIYGKKAFELNDNSIVVTIPYNRINPGEPLPAETEIPGVNISVLNTENSAEDNTVKLSARRRSILDAIRENPEITERQLISLFPMSDTAMQNNLSYLKRNGFIVREGNNRSGRWKVL